jgi:hypothetical protein
MVAEMGRPYRGAETMNTDITLTQKRIELLTKLSAWSKHQFAMICCGYDPDKKQQVQRYRGDQSLINTDAETASVNIDAASNIISQAYQTHDLPAITTSPGTIKDITLFQPAVAISWAKHTALFPDLPKLFYEILEQQEIEIIEHPNLGLMVKLIIHGYELHWKNADPDYPHTHPKNQVVSDWFMQKRCPSRALADAAATMIRPEWAPKGRRNNW